MNAEILKDPDYIKLQELLEKKNNQKIGRPKVLAFNYIWPKYGTQFLKTSIESILPYVDKYILYLNKFSYIGTPCDDSDFERVKQICQQFDDKIQVYINDKDQFPNEVKQDNIGFYFKIAGQYAKEQNYDYVWLVQSDEVYDNPTLELFDESLIRGDFKGKCCVFSLICYIDNPHWKVVPNEPVNRPSLIDVSILASAEFNHHHLNKVKFEQIYFHHLSYVLTTSELINKVNNWGHRQDFDENQRLEFLKKFNDSKINKEITHLNPIIPHLYDHVEFVDNDINRKLYLDWINFLLTYKNPYDEVSTSFKDTVYKNFPEQPDNIYGLTEIERNFIATIVTEFLPIQSRIFEYGSWVGYNFLLMRILNIHSNIIAVDNYDKPDELYQQYESSIDRVYKIAAKRILDLDLPNIKLFNGNPKFCSILKNDSLDFAFINNGINADNLENCLIELWPKIKNGGIIVGHYSINTNILNKIKNIINHNTVVQCPWGQQIFDFYEIYYNIFESIKNELKIEIPVNLGMWVARIRK